MFQLTDDTESVDIAGFGGLAFYKQLGRSVGRGAVTGCPDMRLVRTQHPAIGPVGAKKERAQEVGTIEMVG